MREQSACLYCGNKKDDAKHAIFECAETEEQTQGLRRILKEDVAPDNFVKCMIQN